ncbi:hypothetical protein [Amphibacillus cookii]|uniref:hypothetical protein n=1 Tax=Amphibacillus cookii TaxID=767787 RepID=UPI00195C935E|nr:hypothetical protein [Amphibacillus cookii]MBM7542491.1 hypothetical protein [Amphibacillus cookii]
MDQNKREKQLMQKLKQFPTIKDEQSKTTLYQSIENQLNEKQASQHHSKFKWIIPSIASATLIVLIIIMVQPQWFQNDQLSDTPMTTQDHNVEQKDQQMAIMESEEDDSDDLEDLQGFETLEGGERAGELIYYHDESNRFPIFTIAVSDREGQYVIPISLVSTSSTGDPNDYYNRIHTFIDEGALGVRLFPFEDIHFEFANQNQTIYMTVDDDYQFPQGSTQAYIFQMSINFMFADYPATSLTLRTESHDYIDLGPLGEMESLEIEEMVHLAYKLYQDENRERLLVPLRETLSGDRFYTIDEAFVEMQQTEEEQNIYAPIPIDVTFEVDAADSNQLKIFFESHAEFGNNTFTKEMIESILMTAKSFGFSEVDLTIDGVDSEISNFNLNDPLPVPDAVNPIILH